MIITTPFTFARSSGTLTDAARRWIDAVFARRSLLVASSLGAESVLTWNLPDSKAQMLRPRTRGRLIVQEGRVWITGARDAEESDLVLLAGQGVQLKAGECIVVENWALKTGAIAKLAWRESRER